jgi:spore germination cell wall hydrolase CwlJ-like protein
VRLISDDALAIVTVWTEAEGEPYEAKLGVCEAIRNRARLKVLSDGTIVGTVAKRYQFSAFNDDLADNLRFIRGLQLDDQVPAVKDCARAWAESATSNLVEGATHFYAIQPGTPAPSWAALMDRVGQYGKTIFFRSAA